MNAVSMNTENYASTVISSAIQKQGNALLQLFEVVHQAEVAQAKPFGNIGQVNKVDFYA